MAFLRLLNVDPLHQFLATSSNIYNMQHDLSFYRRHGETVLDSIANQHRLTSLFIFIWMMADFLLSNLKSKLSYLTGFAKQRRWHKHPDQTPNQNHEPETATTTPTMIETTTEDTPMIKPGTTTKFIK